jgi:uncharacterized protein (TIRG00374 family)
VPRHSGALPADRPATDAEPGAPPRPPRSIWIRTAVSAAVGALLLALLLYNTDIDAVGDLMGDLGPRAPLVLLPWLVIAYLDARGWRCSLPPAVAERVPMRAFYLVRMAGEAINSVTPTAAVGGEPVKAYLLRGWGVPASDSVASLVIAKTALTVSQALFVVLGLAALFERLDLAGLGVALVVVLLVLTAGFGGGLVWLQRRGPALSLWRWLRRVAPRARVVARLEERAQAVDDRLAHFYRTEQGGAFLRATLWHMGGWLLGIFEVTLMMALIGSPIGLRDALIIEALAQPIRATAIIIPGGLGTQELGGVALCRFLGFPEPVAVTLWLLKRGREFVFDGLGLVYLAVARRSAPSPRE